MIPKPRFVFEINLGTALIALSMLAAVFLDHQSAAVEFRDHEDRISRLEQDRIDDKRDVHDFQTEVRARLDTIISSIGQLQVGLAAKEDLRRR